MKNLRFLSWCLCAGLMLMLGACGGDNEPGDSTTESSGSNNANANDASANSVLARMEMPNMKKIEKEMAANTKLLVHETSDSYGTNFIVLWDFDKHAQRWTAYQMKKGFAGSAGYNGDFHEHSVEDRTFSTNNNMEVYYSGSGFSRGHICPSADRQYSKTANYQTFCYTNMQPQYMTFNAGPRVNGKQQYTSPWVRLENKLRDWAGLVENEVIYVVKGGTIDHPLMKIKGVLPVPDHFFVALLSKNTRKGDGGYSAIGFYIKHESVDRGSVPLADYAHNIEELEALTGYDFFCNLPDDVEKAVESKPVSTLLSVWKPDY